MVVIGWNEAVGRSVVFDDDSPDAAEDVLSSILELKANLPEEIVKQRSSQRLEIRAKVTARPGNSAERFEIEYAGVTGDVSQNGCQVLFTLPLQVGSVYWLSFDSDDLTIGSVMARCLRCRLVREDAFETGFQFFEEVYLSEIAGGAGQAPVDLP